MKGERGGIGKRSKRGIGWTLLGTAISNLLRVASLALLARLLTPDEFGVVAVAMTVFFFANHVRDLGVGIALVQRRELDEQHAEAAFAFSLLVAIALSGAIFAVAPVVAALYRAPEAEPLVRALAVLFLLRGVSSTSLYLCQRELRFRALALIDLAGYATGSAVAILLAWQGVGAWSLVIGYLAETGLACALLLAVRRPPAPRLRWRPLRELLGFGAGQTAASFANYFATQGDYIVVGRYMDPAALGFYTRAYELIRFPANLFNSVAGAVLFSSFSRLRDEPNRLAGAYRRTLFANAVILLPVTVGAVLLAPEAIRILMGPGWDRAVLPFQVMAVAILFRTSYKASGIVARSAGDIYQVAGRQVLYAAFVTGGALVSVQWGLTGVAATTVAAVIFYFVALTQLALRRLPLGWSAVASAHIPGVACAALVAAVAWPVASALRDLGASALLVAAVTSATGAAAMAFVLVVALRRKSADWVWLVDSVRQAAGRAGRRKQERAEGPKGPPPPADAG